MLNFLNLQPEAFAIDINDVSMRIVKLQKKPKGFCVVSFNEATIPEGVMKDGVIQKKEVLADIIKKTCAQAHGRKLGTKYVIASLPEEKAFSQIIQMPSMTKEELQTAVPFEAENYIPLTIDKVYLDFEQIASGSRVLGAQKEAHANVLINVMPKTVVDG